MLSSYYLFIDQFSYQYFSYFLGTNEQADNPTLRFCFQRVRSVYRCSWEARPVFGGVQERDTTYVMMGQRAKNMPLCNGHRRRVREKDDRRVRSKRGIPPM